MTFYIRLFLQLGHAAKAKKVGIAFFMDEIQFVKEAEFRALISAFAERAQARLPAAPAAFGLPQIHAGQAERLRSCAERLFRFREESGALKDLQRKRHS